jgi:flagellar protein FliS
VATNPAQSRYLADTVSTATPAQLVVMLYDRLGLDLVKAGQAFATDDRAEVSACLLHAHLILAELLANLRTDVWDGADNLASLYSFLIRELVSIRMETNLKRLASCLGIVRGLRSAWSEAANQLSLEAAERRSAASSKWVA